MSGDERDYRVALAGTMPGEQANGWDDDDFLAQLDGNRSRIRYARVAYRVMHKKEITDSGRKILTIQLVQIEPTDDEDDARKISDLYEARTGQATLFSPEE